MAGIVPVGAFRAGSNSLEVFAIEGTARRRLAPLEAQRPNAYRLVEKDGTTAIVGGGRTFMVEDGRLQGYVDRFEIDDQGARLSGWAVDTDGPRPAERLVVFDDGRLVAQATPTLARPDIVQRFGSDAVAKSGFELRGSATGAKVEDLRVFALSSDRATELPRYQR